MTERAAYPEEVKFWLGTREPTLWVYAPPWGGYGLHRYGYVVYPAENR
jgi:hypothetical protein